MRTDAAWGTRLLVFILALFAGSLLAALLVGPPPEGGLPWAGVLAITFGAVVATLVAVTVFEQGEVRTLSAEPDLPASIRLAALGCGGGVLVFALAFGIAAPWGVAAGPDQGGVPELLAVLLSLLGFFVVAAAAEELLFRGYPFVVLERRFGGTAALLVTSILFAAVHLGNPGATVLGLANIGLAGIFLGTVYQRTRSLWCVIGVHAGWNWGMAGPADVPVSGHEQGMDTPLYSLELSGPAWWAGGSFGPEGGVAATLAFLLATLAVRRLVPLTPIPAAMGEGDDE